MRIVDRKEFLQIPTPFMYAKYYDGNISQVDLNINCESLNKDWYYNPLCLEPPFKDTCEMFNHLDLMEKDSSLDILVCDCSITRDGLYGETQKFIVYSKEDFEIFVQLMNKYLNVYMDDKEIKYKS